MTLKNKRELMNQNKYMCQLKLSNLPFFKPIKRTFNKNFNFCDTESFCEVHVKQFHCLNIAKEYILKGFKPIILNVVNNDFNETNIESSENIYDEILNIRTNFFKTIIDQNIYPIRPNEIIYSPMITVIRNETLIMNPSDFFLIDVITATAVYEPKIENNIMNLDDYITIKETLEAIFQTAIQSSHDVLILPDFGCRDEKIPISDILDIYNLSILKYGSLFKYIIIALPNIDNFDKAKFTYFDKNIIKPQNLIENLESLNENLNENIDQVPLVNSFNN